MKRVLQIILAAVAVIGAASFAVSQELDKPGQVVVYYFHGDFRCASCLKIEQYTQESVEQNFKDKLKSGQIALKVINVDKNSNAHYAKDYQLYTKSVVISLVKGGKELKWKNLTKVWDFLRDKDRFSLYIKDEVEQYLREL